MQGDSSSARAACAHGAVSPVPLHGSVIPWGLGGL